MTKNIKPTNNGKKTGAAGTVDKGKATLKAVQTPLKYSSSVDSEDDQEEQEQEVQQETMGLRSYAGKKTFLLHKCIHYYCYIQTSCTIIPLRFFNYVNDDDVCMYVCIII